MPEFLNYAFKNKYNMKYTNYYINDQALLIILLLFGNNSASPDLQGLAKSMCSLDESKIPLVISKYLVDSY